ncbi:MAG: hypothetical protein IJP29_05775 [Lachnospiraceae bacterium]|nr:hypothetical protein [Lachnospiraceae bacterium]
MKDRIKKSLKKQIGFVIVTVIYMIAQMVVSKCLNQSIESLEDVLDLFLGTVFLTIVEIVCLAYGHYFLLLISCAVPKYSIKIIIDIVGLLFNVAYSPIYYFASAFFSIETPGDDYLHQVGIFVSFILVYIVKLVVDIIGCISEKQSQKMLERKE